MKDVLIKNLKGKKLRLDISNKKLKEEVKNSLSDVVFLDENSLEEPDFIITDRLNRDGSAFSDKTIFVFPFTFNLKLISLIFFNLYKIIIYKKNLYLVPEYFVSNFVEKFVLFIFLSILFFHFILIPYIPPDDLLRHLVAHKFDFDYSQVFINTDLPGWDFHFTYDFVAGFIYEVFQKIPIDYFQIYGPIIFIQILTFILFLYGIRLNTRELQLKEFIFIFSLILWAVFERLLLGRPTTFALVLFLIALGLVKNRRENAALIPMAVLAVLYYLFFIYLIPLLFFTRKAIIPIILGVIYWFVYAYLLGGNYFVDVFNYVFSLSNSEIKAGENASLINVIANPLIFGGLILALMYFEKIKKDYLFTSFYFYLSNQIRYLEVIGPLTLLAITPLIKEFIAKGLRGNPLSILIISLSILISSYPRKGSDIVDINVCKEIKESKVKTSLGGNFRLMFFCHNERPKLNPAMEIRWSKDLEIDKKLSKGKIDCYDKKLLEYDYLYEDSLKGTYRCLKLKVVDGKYRLWRLDKSWSLDTR